jgi:NAD(P)-dependent dehydrogenase (short-subunit alcohol dehydrogenase family)
MTGNGQKDYARRSHEFELERPKRYVIKFIITGGGAASGGRLSLTRRSASSSAADGRRLNETLVVRKWWNAQALQADVSRRGCAAPGRGGAEHHRRIDILISNAGIFTGSESKPGAGA